MATWDPQINVFDERIIVSNISTWLQGNQVEALKWANGGVALPSIKNFFISPRIVNNFPTLSFLQSSHDSDWVNDILEIKLELLMEIALIHGNRDTAAAYVKKYAMAIESMLANMPETTFLQGSILTIEATLMQFRVAHAIQEKYKNSYIQVFQVRPMWQLEASAFSR